MCSVPVNIDSLDAETVGSLSPHFPNEHLQECACNASVVTTRQSHSGFFVSTLASLNFLKFVCRFRFRLKQSSINLRMRS
jgi:hypothetical protein